MISQTLSEVIIYNDFKIDDFCNEHANRYDEYLFVYLHECGYKEKYTEEKQVQLILNPCDET